MPRQPCFPSLSLMPHSARYRAIDAARAWLSQSLAQECRMIRELMAALPQIKRDDPGFLSESLDILAANRHQYQRLLLRLLGKQLDIAMLGRQVEELDALLASYRCQAAAAYGEKTV